MTTHRKNNIIKPKSKLNLTASHTKHIPPEPRTVKQALSDKQWRGSMFTELDAFAQNKTYVMVPCQPHKNIVRCCWIYKNIFLPNGDHGRYKSQLVAR